MNKRQFPSDDRMRELLDEPLMPERQDSKADDQPSALMRRVFDSFPRLSFEDRVLGRWPSERPLPACNHNPPHVRPDQADLCERITSKVLPMLRHLRG